MKPWLIGVGVAALALMVVIGLLVRSHLAWLDRQTPAGTWRATAADGKELLLVFKGGPHEGTYFHFTRLGDSRLREFGHWNVHRRRLSMFIMATDVADHPRFGIATPHQLVYLSYRAIKIKGPDQPDVVYEKIESTPELERELSMEVPLK